MSVLVFTNIASNGKAVSPVVVTPASAVAEVESLLVSPGVAIAGNCGETLLEGGVTIFAVGEALLTNGMSFLGVPGDIGLFALGVLVEADAGCLSDGWSFSDGRVHGEAGRVVALDELSLVDADTVGMYSVANSESSANSALSVRTSSVNSDESVCSGSVLESKSAATRFS